MLLRSKRFVLDDGINFGLDLAETLGAGLQPPPRLGATHRSPKRHGQKRLNYTPTFAKTLSSRLASCAAR